MKKLLFLIVILFIVNIISFKYLKNLSDNRQAFIFKPDCKAIIIPKKEIVLDNIEEFKIDDYFHIYTLNDYLLNYEFDDNHIDITLDDNNYIFDYEIRQPEIVEVIIYKEKEVSKPNNNNNNNLSNNNNNQNQTNLNNDENINIPHITETINNQNTTNFTLLRNSLSYPIDTDINKIISDIYSSFTSSVVVNIDFSLLNPGSIGNYEIYLNHEGTNDILTVNIF